MHVDTMPQPSALIMNQAHHCTMRTLNQWEVAGKSKLKTNLDQYNQIKNKRIEHHHSPQAKCVISVENNKISLRKLIIKYSYSEQFATSSGKVTVNTTESVKRSFLYDMCFPWLGYLKKPYIQPLHIICTFPGEWDTSEHLITTGTQNWASLNSPTPQKLIHRIKE